MNRRWNPFAKKKRLDNSFYDIDEDWSLVEASINKQYGIRIRSCSDMSWSEFLTLVAGLMPDTPLGSVVAIRAEKDSKVIRGFSPEQRRIHREYQNRIANHKLDDKKSLEDQQKQLNLMMARMFG